MSDTLDQTEPAEATRSVDLTGTTRTESPTSACGTATFDFPPIEETSGSVSFIPSGAKMRVRMNTSHGLPDARSMIVPPSAYITFWYCHSDRKDAVGWMYRRRRMISDGA